MRGGARKWGRRKNTPTGKGPESTLGISRRCMVAASGQEPEFSLVGHVSASPLPQRLLVSACPPPCVR
ncbi:hypothetical protein N658DRAFT_238812 [Parathielavia hyrcaniae]|uniref:Uncharacterized protein n=1 Tax=Parathielavia hyrcaniae TaxID=113614 RepID=A0AAN6Q5N1_9PEZI|nr:hypothetical protein N658DRAFT_238812 [Parathielavia hyrcaniae]